MLVCSKNDHMAMRCVMLSCVDTESAVVRGTYKEES